MNLLKGTSPGFSTNGSPEGGRRAAFAETCQWPEKRLIAAKLPQKPCCMRNSSDFSAQFGGVARKPPNCFCKPPGRGAAGDALLERRAPALPAAHCGECSDSTRDSPAGLEAAKRCSNNSVWSDALVISTIKRNMLLQHTFDAS